MIFETHAHYDDEAFDEDREELLESLEPAGIGKVINVCAEVSGWERTVALTERYPFVYGAVGVHPDDVGSLDEAALERMRVLCGKEKIVAVGEIGLDYYWDKQDHQTQIFWFERQMEVARETGLPFIIHSREAARDTLETVKRVRAGEIGGVVHCFSYEKEMAREFLNMGLYLGIGGVVTFKNGRKLKEVVEYAPLDRLLLETDAPYMAPVPHRGKRNDSSLIPLVAEKIGELRGLEAQAVLDITAENAARLFGLG